MVPERRFAAKSGDQRTARVSAPPGSALEGSAPGFRPRAGGSGRGFPGGAPGRPADLGSASARPPEALH